MMAAIIGKNCGVVTHQYELSLSMVHGLEGSNPTTLVGGLEGTRPSQNDTLNDRLFFL